MGGAFLVPGNVSAVAEANFWSDPVAANIVINYAKNANIFPLNVTMNAVLYNELFSYAYLPVKVETNKTISYGQSIADFRPTEQFTADQNPHKIAVNFEYKNFYNDFMNIMTK